MRAFDGFLPVLGEGQEHVKAFVTVVAYKVIGWHGFILIEIAAVRKYCFVALSTCYSCLPASLCDYRWVFHHCNDPIYFVQIEQILVGILRKSL